MPERNRVTPLGDIVAIPLRGAWTGNRGRLHDGHDIVRFHSGTLWIVCGLEFRGRWQPQWQPHHYTFLFFRDEAVAFAAGHRPCAECRHASYTAYVDAWASAAGAARPSANAVNSRLHAERLYAGTHRRRLHEVAWREVPDGAFVLSETAPALVLGDALVPWTATGYGEASVRPHSGRALMITPPSTAAVLREGYPVQIDAAARTAAGGRAAS
ncbi:hypothetical protein [Humibacter ginsenosidimutans]|uniref:Uncharacterized protein n=1 Tax=Humibacter ginsenosidimutans TaxID=2599293 RepID=A0A5B8M143_9MICO|nr:hypothetical protein [Humibacter ginsenosidimutans]QDZ14043.1 hypothetical protein FPZ11_03935 [Humibacter ginsenosidimutans]